MTCQYCGCSGKKRVFLARCDSQWLYICVWDWLQVWDAW